MRRLNPHVLVALAGVVILLLLFLYVASTRNPDQDKLKDSQVATGQPAATSEKRCASAATYDLIKRQLFRHAAQVRGSDQSAYDRLAAYAAIRVENPVLESDNKDTGAVNCSGSLSLDLPPGVAVVGGRRTLTSDIDYTVQPAADGSGNVVLLRNADAIVTPLATLARTAGPQPAPPAATQPTVQPAPIPAPAPAPGTAVEPARPNPPPRSAPAPRTSSARPSFDCSRARTRGEVAVCGDAGLAALDRNMSAQFSRAMASGDEQQQELLRRTRDRFLRYRDRCPDNRCVGDAYVGRMREIRDIVEGRWRPR